MNTLSNLTDEELQTKAAEAAQAAHNAQSSAQADLEAVQTEQMRRAEQQQAEKDQARNDWAEWFLDGGGYTQLKNELSEAEKEARDEFATLIAQSPLGQAAARYYATVEARQHAIDLREEAHTILGRSFNAVVLQNRTDLTAETVKVIETQARNIAGEHWEALKDTQTSTTPRQWAADGKAPEERVEEYTVAGPPAYGRPVHMRRNIATGNSEVVDPTFTAWQAQHAEEATPMDAPPAWTKRHTPEEARKERAQTRPRTTH